MADKRLNRLAQAQKAKTEALTEDFEELKQNSEPLLPLNQGIGNKTKSIITNYIDEQPDKCVLERQTYYFTLKEIEAIKYISYHYDLKKSEVVRCLIDKAMQDYFPDVIDDIKEKEHIKQKLPL